jgi:glycosidase
VAGYVPLDFWDNARAELDEIKPVFMLAEWEARDLHARAFDMSYGWQWYATMERLAQGETDVGALFQYYAENQGAFPVGGMRMLGVTNHDKNAWEGTEYEVFGDAVEAAVVLSVISEGMPLIYNGQEAGNPKRLAFFERDPIVWQPHPMGELYRRLFALKKANSTLWNGHWGAPMIQAVNSAPMAVFSFVRQNNSHKVFAAFNFSDQPQDAHFSQSLIAGRYTNFADGTVEVINGAFTLELDPWEYRLYVE